MPLKPEDVLTALDIDPAKFDDVNAFTDTFGKEWLRRSEAVNDEEVRGAVFGKINAVQRQKARKVLSGLGFEDVKVDDMDPADIFPLIGEKVSAKFTELQQAATKGGKPGPELEAERAKYGELERKFNDLNGLHEKQVQKYNELETGFRDKEWNMRRTDYVDAAKRQVQVDHLDEFQKEGFFSRALSLVDLRRDDKEAIYVVDKQTGDRIAEPGKAQKFLDLAPFLSAKLKEWNMDKKNPHGGKPVGGQRPNASAMPTRTDTERPVRSVHPGRALMHRS